MADTIKKRTKIVFLTDFFFELPYFLNVVNLAGLEKISFQPFQQKEQ